MVLTAETNEEQLFLVGMLAKSAIESMLPSEGARQGGRSGSPPAGGWTHSKPNDWFASSPCLRLKVIELAAAAPLTEEPFWPAPLFCRIKYVVFGIVLFSPLRDQSYHFIPFWICVVTETSVDEKGAL